MFHFRFSSSSTVCWSWEFAWVSLPLPLSCCLLDLYVAWDAALICFTEFLFFSDLPMKKLASEALLTLVNCCLDYLEWFWTDIALRLGSPLNCCLWWIHFWGLVLVFEYLRCWFHKMVRLGVGYQVSVFSIGWWQGIGYQVILSSCLPYFSILASVSLCYAGLCWMVLGFVTSRVCIFFTLLSSACFFYYAELCRKWLSGYGCFRFLTLVICYDSSGVYDSGSIRFFVCIKVETGLGCFWGGCSM